MRQALLLGDGTGAKEHAVVRRTLEIASATHRAIVLAVTLVELNAHPDARGECGDADEAQDAKLPPPVLAADRDAVTHAWLLRRSCHLTRRCVSSASLSPNASFRLSAGIRSSRSCGRIRAITACSGRLALGPAASASALPLAARVAQGSLGLLRQHRYREGHGTRCRLWGRRGRCCCTGRRGAAAGHVSEVCIELLSGGSAVVLRDHPSPCSRARRRRSADGSQRVQRDLGLHAADLHHLGGFGLQVRLRFLHRLLLRALSIRPAEVFQVVRQLLRQEEPLAPLARHLGLVHLNAVVVL
mmetsp:Transcript_5966/g.15209  ORF Transcript_5966/g.15209 Transcript_5966/m.15209 type:complete len:300 (-) Transcript_5966:91-990(-)